MSVFGKSTQPIVSLAQNRHFCPWGGLGEMFLSILMTQWQWGSSTLAHCEIRMEIPVLLCRHQMANGLSFFMSQCVEIQGLEVQGYSHLRSCWWGSLEQSTFSKIATTTTTTLALIILPLVICPTRLSSIWRRRPPLRSRGADCLGHCWG